jgi:hypothetical protein
MSEREIRIRMGTNGRITMELVDPLVGQCLEARTELWSAGEIPAVGQEVQALLMEDAERMFPAPPPVQTTAPVAEGQVPPAPRRRVRT